jgi:hypothetical protein
MNLPSPRNQPAFANFHDEKGLSSASRLGVCLPAFVGTTGHHPAADESSFINNHANNWQLRPVCVRAKRKNNHWREISINLNCKASISKEPFC